MKKIFYEQAEQLKKNIENAAKKSKETIGLIISSNSQHLSAAIDANKKMVDNIKEQFYTKNVDPAIIANLKKTFGTTVELSEEVIDTIIDAHVKRIESIIDFNIRLMDILKEQEFKDNDAVEKLLKLIQGKFDESVQLSINNMKKVIEVYNKHLNLALNFNKKFYGNINAQMDTMFSLQNKSIDSFNSWATEWWKQNSKEEARV